MKRGPDKPSIAQGDFGYAVPNTGDDSGNESCGPAGGKDASSNVFVIRGSPQGRMSDNGSYL